MAGSPEAIPRLQTAPFSLHRDGTAFLRFPERQKPAASASRSFENVSFNPAGKTIVSFINPERRAQGPDIFSTEWVQFEVKKERQIPIKEGKTPWYHLPGTGFWVKEQGARLMRDVQNDGVDSALIRVREDFNAFEREYLKQMVSLRWNLAVGEVDGRQRIICSDYENATLESVTNKEERHGVVYDTLFGDKKKGMVGVEEQILDAPVGTMAIIVSPEGWSGLLDADGNEIRYTESQTVAIMKLADGRIQAYTFRSEANILQNEAFQKSLGLPIPEVQNQKDRIKGVLVISQSLLLRLQLRLKRMEEYLFGALEMLLI